MNTELTSKFWQERWLFLVLLPSALGIMVFLEKLFNFNIALPAGREMNEITKTVRNVLKVKHKP
jgi:hypothetical protein